MTGNPFTPNSKWEAVKLIFALTVVLPLLSIKDAVKGIFKKKAK